MDDRYQLPSATSLSLPAKISPEIRATIFYPVSTDASSRRSKPVLFAIRSSAFLFSRFRFPNYRRKISQFTSERANPLLEEYYFAGRIRPPSFSIPAFIYEYPSIHPCLLLRGTKHEDINTISESSGAFRFASASALSSLISFSLTVTRSATGAIRAKGIGKKAVALRKIRFDFIEGIRICPKIKKTLRFPEKSRPSISRDKTLTITCTEAEIELFFCQNNLAIK